MKYILNKLQEALSKTKIRNQLYAIYIVAILLPILGLGTYLVGSTAQLLQNYHRDSIESDNLRVKTILFEITSQIYNISEEISFNTTLQYILKAHFTTENNFVVNANSYKDAENYTNNYAEIADISIYTNNASIIKYKEFKPVTDDVKKSAWYEKAIKQSSTFWMPIENVDKYGNHYWNLCLIRKIPLIGSDNSAVLVIKVSDNYLKSRIDNNEYSTIVSVDKNEIFYSSMRELYGEKQTLYINYEDAYYNYTGEAYVNDERFLCTISTLPIYQSDNNIYVSTLNESTYKNINKILFVCILIILAAIVLPGFLITIFTRYFVGRVEILRGEMHKASNEDYNIESTIRGEDELSEAFADLQIMITKIKQKDAKMYEALISEKELMNEQQVMEFKMLASQINPHFLYNTLETIRMKAFKAGNKEVATATKLLGKSMRYVLENTGTSSTTLKNELDYIETYMMIQKLRFEDKVNYKLVIEENMRTEEYQILPLLLQPVVENAILHGLEEKEKDGMITVSVSRKEDETLFIKIEDNGGGMLEEDLKQLRKKMQTPNLKIQSSIGLYNISQRIRLCYGESYGMTITSEKEVGTAVLLTLPLINTSIEHE